MQFGCKIADHNISNFFRKTKNSPPPAQPTMKPRKKQRLDMDTEVCRPSKPQKQKDSKKQVDDTPDDIEGGSLENEPLEDVIEVEDDGKSFSSAGSNGRRNGH
jgi:hypothetical protein